MEKTSCLISCFKKEDPIYLKKALESICTQTLPSDEVVLVEDGELTEELYLILDYYDLKLPLKRVKLKKNVGLGAALRIGLNNCTNEIVFRMDTDDICHPDRFEKQYNVFANTNADIVGSWAEDIDENGKFLKLRKVPESNEEIKKLIWTCPIIHPAVAYRKEKIQKIDSYSLKLERRQDYDLWFRAVEAGLVFYNIPESLIKYRFTDNYYKKNNFNVALSQFKIGFKGIRKVKSPPIAYLGILFPLIRSIFPVKLSKKIDVLIKKFDPRKI